MIILVKLQQARYGHESIVDQIGKHQNRHGHHYYNLKQPYLLISLELDLKALRSEGVLNVPHFKDKVVKGHPHENSAYNSENA